MIKTDDTQKIERKQVKQKPRKEAAVKSQNWAYDDEFMGFVSDTHTLNTIKEASTHFFEAPKLNQTNLKQAYLYLKEKGMPEIALLDLSNEDDIRAAAQALMALSKNTQLILIGRENEVNLYRDLIELGVADYLVKPVTAHETQRAINRIMDMKKQQDDEADLYEQILVMGCRGGVGASTLAANLAWVLAEEMNERTQLVDFDVHFGTAALMLDLQPCGGLRDALRKPDRLDQLLLSSTTAKVTKKLCVLALEESPNSELRIDPAAARFVCNYMEEGNRFGIIDLPRGAVHLYEEMMKKSNYLLLVSDLSLASIRDCVRLKKLARQINPKLKVSFVVNRVQDIHCQLAQKDFERGVNDKISFEIPDDPKSVAKAANAGAAISKLDKKAKSAEAIRAIARHFSAGKKVDQQGWLKKLLGAKKTSESGVRS